MILAIDMGNTNIVIGCVDDTRVLFEERLATDLRKTELEYVVIFKTVLELYGIDHTDINGAIISSVVPQLVNIIQSAVEKLLRVTPIVVGPNVRTGLNIMMDEPGRVGSDLIVDAVAATALYGTPNIVIDMGTATTMSVVDRDGNYVGGVIMPGIKVALDSLVSRTAQLQSIALEAPANVVGKNTINCMKSGVIYGNAACIDGMIDRMSEELGEPLAQLESGWTEEQIKAAKGIKVIATGGLSKVIIPECKHQIIRNDELLLQGLKEIYDMNQ